MMKKKLSKTDEDILRFTEMHGTYKVVGVVWVLAARRLAADGLVTMVSDDADEWGIGDATLQHKAEVTA
jgi:hypothetical protein